MSVVGGLSGTRPPSALYYVVPGDLCDRSVSVCSWIPASNNHSDPFLFSVVSTPPHVYFPRCVASFRARPHNTETQTLVRRRKIAPVATTPIFVSRDFVPMGDDHRRHDPPTANRNKFHADHATNGVVSIRSIFIELSRQVYCLFSLADPRLDASVRGGESRGQWLLHPPHP